MVAAERVFEILDTAPGIADLAEARPLPSLRESLELEDVHFAYIPEREVLGELRVEAGQLVGPSRRADPDRLADSPLPAGAPAKRGILIGGMDIRRRHPGSLRGQIALVPPEPVLFGISVRENIAYGHDAPESAGDYRRRRAA